MYAIRNKRILILSFLLPFLIIASFFGLRYIKSVNESQTLVEIALERQDAPIRQGESGLNEMRIAPRPVPTDIVGPMMDIVNFILGFIIYYSIFMLSYGIYKKIKKEEDSKKIIRFYISLILLTMFAYAVFEIVTTVLLC